MLNASPFGRTTRTFYDSVELATSSLSSQGVSFSLLYGYENSKTLSNRRRQRHDERLLILEKSRVVDVSEVVYLLASIKVINECMTSGLSTIYHYPLLYQLQIVQTTMHLLLLLHRVQQGIRKPDIYQEQTQT